jgi:biotin carboxyl carrier protein
MTAPITVRIGDQTFVVVIDDLEARPIRALVDGQPIEVWPETEAERSAVDGLPAAAPSSPTPAVALRRAPATSAVTNAGGAGERAGLRAPIPGIIASVEVTIGQRVAAGEVVCVLEAMKMKNLLRAPRDGQVAAIHAAPGQQVRHHDLLVSFEPQNSSEGA